MKITVSSPDITRVDTHCLVIPVHENGRWSASARKVEAATQGLISTLVKAGDIDGRPGAVLMTAAPSGINAQRLLLVGVGEKPDADDFARAAVATAQRLCATPATNAVVTLAEISAKGIDPSTRARVLAQALHNAAYRFNQLKTDAGKEAVKRGCALTRVTLMPGSSNTASVTRAGVKEATAIANGMKLAQDLGNLPGNLCTPSYLAIQARKLSRSHGLGVKILDEAKMKSLKMGALLSVSRGSREPARFIVMEHRGGKSNEAPVVLVGKGITFDAGGISLKPASAMDEMKYDMCGGASVFGALLAAAELQLKLNVVGIVPSSENLPDGAANKSGDIAEDKPTLSIGIENLNSFS
jgi:leucyl aminopeptidase